MVVSWTAWKRPAAGTEVETVDSPAVATALDDAERTGFRLAAIGRSAALAAIGVFYFISFQYPFNLRVTALILAIAAIGLAPLLLVGSRYERVSRYAFFTFDIVVISALLAFAPLSSGGDVPQNLVFLISRRDEYYLVVVAVSMLALSPALVLWTGGCAVAGLAGATIWIIAGMPQLVSTGDLPPAPSRDAFIAVVLNPDFLGIPARVSVGMVIALITCVGALAVHRARNVVRAHAAGEARRSRIQQLFGRYVPSQVAEELMTGEQLGPRLHEASVLFADIEGFTGLSERLPPPEVIRLLDSFFGAATVLVDHRGGVVVNHVGDAMIVAFNAPLPVDGHAGRAVDTARALLALVETRDFEGHRLRLRIGVATGPVAAGTVGGTQRQTYTLYGDTVNLAQRLERLNKELGTDCLVCGTTFDAAQPPDAASVGTVQVRGRDSAVAVFAFGARS